MAKNVLHFQTVTNSKATFSETYFCTFKHNFLRRFYYAKSKLTLLAFLSAE